MSWITQREGHHQYCPGNELCGGCPVVTESKLQVLFGSGTATALCLFIIDEPTGGYLWQPDWCVHCNSLQCFATTMMIEEAAVAVPLFVTGSYQLFFTLC